MTEPKSAPRRLVARLPRRLTTAATTAALAFGVLSATAVIAAAPASAVIESSACKISGPVAPRFDTAEQRAMNGNADFVQYEATDGHGTYTGIAYTETFSGGQFKVIRYSAGKVSVLDTINYSTGSWQPNRSVQVVGVDDWGNSIVNVQPPGTSEESDIQVTYRYDRGGHRTVLQSSPLWQSFHAVGVTPLGVVIGAARYGGLSATNIATVRWSGGGHGNLVVLTAKSSDQPMAVDRRGDVVFATSALLAGGQRLALGQYAGTVDVYATVASGYGAAGIDQVGNAHVGSIWSIPASAGSATTITPSRLGYFTSIEAVGLQNDAVGEYPVSSQVYGDGRVLLTRGGKVYRMPRLYARGEPSQPAVVMDDYGQVMYTATDGLPHLMSCPA